MTKKELLESKAFQEMPDDAEILFRTNKQLPMCEPLASKHLFLTHQCTNIDAVMRVPFYVKQRPVAKYKTTLIIDAMPFDYMANTLNMTFDL